MNYFSFVVLLFFINLYNTGITEKKALLERDYIDVVAQTSSKTEAFAVLRDKCNVCHATKKRTDIFTLKNMDTLAKAVHEQVFIKKKMPKGRKVSLTKEELEILRTWLSESTTIAIEQK